MDFGFWIAPTDESGSVAELETAVDRTGKSVFNKLMQLAGTAKNGIAATDL